MKPARITDLILDAWAAGLMVLSVFFFWSVKEHPFLFIIMFSTLLGVLILHVRCNFVAAMLFGPASNSVVFYHVLYNGHGSAVIFVSGFSLVLSVVYVARVSWTRGSECSVLPVHGKRVYMRRPKKTL